jgi:hypothetical protein
MCKWDEPPREQLIKLLKLQDRTKKLGLIREWEEIRELRLRRAACHRRRSSPMGCGPAAQHCRYPGCGKDREMRRWLNDRAENGATPPSHNHFKLYRAAALADWRGLLAD